MKQVQRKAVMKQSQLESKYHRTFTIENRNKENKIIFATNYAKRNLRNFFQI